MKLRNCCTFALLAAVLGLASMSGQAAVFSWSTVLDELQAGQLPFGTSNPNDEPARPTSSGTGTGFGTYDDVLHILNWNFTITGLSSPATLAHFHFGAPGAFRGPVRIETPSLDIGALLGNTSGSFSGSQDFDDPFTPGLPPGGVPQLASELLAGNWYINIHTRNFGAGEIRGQIGIPEPATAALVGLGLLGFATVRRRKI